MLARWLRLWFGFRDPINRGTYFRHGAGLMALKYAIGAMLGVAASLVITLITVGVGVYLRRSYSAGLFLGVPFTIGYISSYIYNYRAERPAGQSIVIALASVTIAAGALVLFALEGSVCTLMALPGGRTRLEGRTTYVVDMFPQMYWTVPARAIVTAIHARVLHHIQTLAEE